MEYSIKEVVGWTFAHSDVKAATNNYLYLCNNYCGDYTKVANSDFVLAVQKLAEIAEIGNPNVCRPMFVSAGQLFQKARKSLTDEEKLLSYLGEMICNHWTGQDVLNLNLQQEISTIEYHGTFWERHGDKVLTLASAAIAGVGMLCGAPASTAAGASAKGARGLLDSHSDEFDASKRFFNEFRNAILSLKF